MFCHVNLSLTRWPSCKGRPQSAFSRSCAPSEDAHHNTTWSLTKVSFTNPFLFFECLLVISPLQGKVYDCISLCETSKIRQYFLDFGKGTCLLLGCSKKKAKHNAALAVLQKMMGTSDAQSSSVVDQLSAWGKKQQQALYFFVIILSLW